MMQQYVLIKYAFIHTSTIYIYKKIIKGKFNKQKTHTLQLIMHHTYFSLKGSKNYFSTSHLGCSSVYQHLSIN